MIHFRHSCCHRIRKSCLFPGKRIKYFFGRQVGRQVLNNCVRAHKEAEESGRYGGSKGIFEASHPPASLPPIFLHNHRFRSAIRNAGKTGRFSVEHRATVVAKSNQPKNFQIEHSHSSRVNSVTRLRGAGVPPSDVLD